MSKIIAVGDVHHGPNFEQIEATIEREQPDLTVFVGDYFDQFGDQLEHARLTAKWLKSSLSKPNRLITQETTSAAAAAGVPRQKLEYAYDAQGRRIVKKVYGWNPTPGSWLLTSDSRFLYDRWNLVAEFSSASQISNPQLSNLARTYVWGLDLSGSSQGAGGVGGLLAVSQISNSQTYLPTYDGNGNVIGLVNASDGMLAAEFEYDPFGNTIKAVGAASNVQPFGFSTKYTDPETSLCYYGLRYYNPSTGRWLSRDPIEESGGANLYGAVGNNLVNKVDVLGQKDLKEMLDEIFADYCLQACYTSAYYKYKLRLDNAEGKYRNTIVRAVDGITRTGEQMVIDEVMKVAIQGIVISAITSGAGSYFQATILAARLRSAESVMSTLRVFQAAGGFSKLEGAIIRTAADIARIKNQFVIPGKIINAIGSTGTGLGIAWAAGETDLAKGTAINFGGDLAEGFLLPGTYVDDIVQVVHTTLSAAAQGLPASLQKRLTTVLARAKYELEDEMGNAAVEFTTGTLGCWTNYFKSISKVK